MDYSRLKASALKSSEDEEAVTVDTRALIDKVLARYSGEWTTLRELIQNAADAQATTVKIKWETRPSTRVPLPSTANRSELLKHVLANHTLQRLLVQNNGQPFTKTDWARLKRIAEGNPDETKIGAFGVGFYSVFADCEEPFISSGNEAMAFYWKGNALFTRKIQLPAEQNSGETAFVLDYRNDTTSIPDVLSICQFLATSLTFVALQNIEFWIDDWKILHLQKKASPTTPVTLPSTLERMTKEGLMTLVSAHRMSSQIDASGMSVIGWQPQVSVTASKSTDSYGFNSSDMPSLRNFFSKLTASASEAAISRSKAVKEQAAFQESIAQDLTAISKSSIFLRVTTATIETKVTTTFATELERATKKSPPKMTKLSILTSSYDEMLASQSTTASTAAAKGPDVFASVLPSKKPGGKVFIGFPTGQTTGAGLHISAPSVIPTVEREAIDLNATLVKKWNMEMLRVAGILTRLAFSSDMAELDYKFKRLAETGSKASVPSAQAIAKLIPEALHIMDTYAFRDSTPSGYVGQIIEEAFWTAHKRPSIELFSSRGVLPTTRVRLDSDELAKFVDGIPIVIKETKENPFIKKLIDFGLIQTITFDDIRQELSAKTLDKDQLTHFIDWAGKCSLAGTLDPTTRQSLLSVAVAAVGDGQTSVSIIALSAIETYLVPGKIPANLPLPPTTIPFAFTTNVNLEHLQALNWRPLAITPWLQYLLRSSPKPPDEENVAKSPEFAAQVLAVLCKNWDQQDTASKAVVVELLRHCTVIPTKVGMKKPNEAYFASVKLFDDLPIIKTMANVKEKFLAALGVRKTVALDTIFSRLLNESPNANGKESPDSGDKRPKWSHVELVKYLSSVRIDIPAADMQKLRDSRFCPAEAGPPGKESTQPTTKLFRVRDLFEPKDSLRALKLPILQWPGAPGSRPGNTEAQFLRDLGLRTMPNGTELVDMMASDDEAHREQARIYYIANHHTNGYTSFKMGETKKAILPVLGNEKALVPPSACYTNERASLLGFTILRRDLQPHAHKFGVAVDPPVTECVQRLIQSPPPHPQAAVALFEYFASRNSELKENSLAKLRDAPIVPVARRVPIHGASSNYVHRRPQHCYLGSSATYGQIFDFVDFGSSANVFLFKCGSKTEPSKLEIANLVSCEPARLLSTFQSTDTYLDLLRTLAENHSEIKKDKELFRRLKAAPFLLAWQDIPSQKAKSSEFEDEEQSLRKYQLATANQIVVLDDYISFRLFKSSLLCAPEEEKLEDFYLALGAQMLGNIVQENVKIGPHSDKQSDATALRKHIMERSKIFLYEYEKSHRESIRHNAKWLDQQLTVEVVRSVALRRTLRGSDKSHLEKRSAANATTAAGRHVLYVSMETKIDFYQVGQALCHLLLHRPNQTSYFFFENFLKLDLLDLKARGYNIDRILRAKQAEARIAEEERRRALEAEERAIKQREQEWPMQNQTVATAGRQEAPRSPRQNMPGGFSDDPDSPHQTPSPPRRSSSWKGRSLFSNFSRRFGLDHNSQSDAQQSLQQSQQQATNPHPDTKSEQGASKGKGRQEDDTRVTPPAAVEQNLLNAIKATRAHGSSSLFAPPTKKEVKEQATYCDSTHEHNLNFIAEAPNGMRVFLDKSASVEPGEFLAAHIDAIALFEDVLEDVVSVYGLSKSVTQMYYDETGPSIAFNSMGSLFCNLRFFIQLHASKLRADATQDGAARADAMVYWWVVLAHELAHNLESTHNASHSFYTESFVQKYFTRMTAKLGASATATLQGSLQGPTAPASGGPGGGNRMPPSYQKATGSGNQGLSGRPPHRYS